MATSFAQGEASLFTITTPLGKDKLLLRGFRGSEGMSRLFRFELDLLSEDPSIQFIRYHREKRDHFAHPSGRYTPVLQRGYQPLWPRGLG